MSKENLTVLLSSSATHSLQASQNTDLKMSIALTAVRTMLKSDRFDVCTVRSVCEIIGANASGTAFEMLRALHCLRYSEMPRDVQAGIPDLMREVFSQVKIDDEAIQGIFKGVRA
jgi:hypothetical protein